MIPGEWTGAGTGLGAVHLVAEEIDNGRVLTACGRTRWPVAVADPDEREACEECVVAWAAARKMVEVPAWAS